MTGDGVSVGVESGGVWRSRGRGLDGTGETSVLRMERRAGECANAEQEMGRAGHRGWRRGIGMQEPRPSQ